MCQGEARGVVALAGGGGQPGAGALGFAVFGVVGAEAVLDGGVLFAGRDGLQEGVVVRSGAGVARALDGERQRRGAVVCFRFGQGGEGADEGEVLPVPVVVVLLFPARGAHGVVGQVAVLFAEGLGEAGGVAVALFGGTGGVGQGFVFVGRQAEGVRQVVSGGQLVGGVAVAVVACLLKPGARVCRVVPERGDAEQAHRGGIAAGGGFFQPLATFAGVACVFACGAQCGGVVLCEGGVLPDAAAVRADVFARELGEPVVGVGFVVVGGEEEGGEGFGVVAQLVGGKQGEDAARGVRRGVVLRGGLFVPLAGNSEVLPVAFAARVHLPKAVLGGSIACFGARLPVVHRGKGGGGAGGKGGVIRRVEVLRDVLHTGGRAVAVGTVARRRPVVEVAQPLGGFPAVVGVVVVVE